MKYSKHIKIKRAVGGLLAGFASVLPAAAVNFVSIDMDLVAPGIQSERAASLGDTFTIGLILTVDAAGVSSYGISALFDNTEINLNGFPAATELLPAGFTFNFTPGVLLESNPLGEVLTFEAGTFGAGPVSTSFTIGTIDFITIAVPTNDGLPDITPGLFNFGVDGIFDNAGNDVSTATIFSPAFLVPEPSHAALLFCGVIFLSVAGCRMCQSRRSAK